MSNADVARQCRHSLHKLETKVGFGEPEGVDAKQRVNNAGAGRGGAWRGTRRQRACSRREASPECRFSDSTIEKFGPYNNAFCRIVRLLSRPYPLSGRTTGHTLVFPSPSTWPPSEPSTASNVSSFSFASTTSWQCSKQRRLFPIGQNP